MPQTAAITQSGNLYAYCINNPVLYADSTGHSIILACILAGVFIGIAIGHEVALYNGYDGTSGWDYWKYVLGFGIGGGVIGLTGGSAISALFAGSATASVGSAGLAGATTISGTGITFYKTLDQGLNFAAKPLEHMLNPDRFVPVQTLIDAIKYGTPMADPRGSRAVMYTIEMAKGDVIYILEVLYDVATNTVWHFQYSR